MAEPSKPAFVCTLALVTGFSCQMYNVDIFSSVVNKDWRHKAKAKAKATGRKAKTKTKASSHKAMAMAEAPSHKADDWAYMDDSTRQTKAHEKPD